MKIQELKHLCENFSLLYVEDDENIANLFIHYFENLFHTVYYAKNGQVGLELYQSKSPDIIITDIQMPVLDGLSMAKQIKELNSEQFILVVSAYSDVDKLVNSIQMGIDGYILKPIDYDLLNQTLLNILTKLKKIKEHAVYEEKLYHLLHQKSSQNHQLEQEKIQNYEQTLYALIEIIESRDTYTGKHSLRVAQYSKKIAQQLQYNPKECEEVYKAAMLHDLGKIGIPDTLLLKPGKLNEQEYNLIQQHVNIGYHMLNQIPMFKNIAQIINAHHERGDGSGYPNGLFKEDIPRGATILAVADTFDAMTTNRIYKHRKSVQEALLEIEQLQETHYTKEVVQAALQALKDIQIDENINQLPHTTLEEERFSFFYKDALCNVYNHTYLDFILAKNRYEPQFEYLNYIKLKKFGKYNKTKGWTQGNLLLQDIAQKLKQLYTQLMIFRIHGDDFIILSSQKEPFKNNHLHQLNTLLKDTPIHVEHQTFEIEPYNINSLNSFETLI